MLLVLFQLFQTRAQRVEEMCIRDRITTIPTAPAVAGAYFALDGEMRTSLPLMKTPYERPKMPRYW